MRNPFLDYAAAGLRLPIGTDLVLRDHSEPEAILHDGPQLGRVIWRRLSATRPGNTNQAGPCEQGVV